MDLLDRAAPAPLTAAHPGLAIVPLHSGDWRVTRRDGAVLGYVERVGDGADARYRGKRMVARERRFTVLGEFWSADDAVDALQFA